MAPKSLIQVALDSIDSQIADLTRAKALIVAAANDSGEPEATPKKRGRRRKTGMPASTDTTGSE